MGRGRSVAEPSAAVACSVEQAQLGEGVRWDARRGELLRVDILMGRVFRDTLDDDGDLHRVATYELPEAVGAIAPIAGDDGWLLAAGRGFVHLHPDGSSRVIAVVAPAGTRMNDAACDPQGRLWSGTLADDHRDGGGALFRLDRDGVCQMMADRLTISNGLGWSPDGHTMYLVDSGPAVIYEFAFDPRRGTLSDQRVLAALDPEHGVPDGMTVDAAGDLWVAVYGGACVHRYTPHGELRQVISVPAVQCTCCAFAGPGLHSLYITTATEGWTDKRRRADTAAGSVYRIDTDATGRAAQSFRPDPQWWTTVID
jgi:sugar lactone lactonase YvrE